jgi:sugar lactone lactonase YvrE
VAEGGQVLQQVTTSRLCFACMLGGPDGRTLFMLTCENSLASVASIHRTGQIEVLDVLVPHAGRP